VLRAVRQAGEREQHRPAADVARAHARQRAAHGGDLAARADEGRVGEPDELVGKAGVLRDQPLERLERRRLARACQRGQAAEAVRRDGVALDEERLGEEVALEGVEAELPAELVLRARLDLLGEQGQVPAAQPRDGLLERLAGELADVELDRVGVLDELLPAGIEAEVVERDLEAGLAQLGEDVEQRRVHGLALEELEHHALGRQRQRADAEQELARDVDPGQPFADETVEPDGRGIHPLHRPDDRHAPVIGATVSVLRAARRRGRARPADRPSGR
jgi:hypothetical protein